MLNFWPILRVHMLIGFMLIKKTCRLFIRCKYVREAMARMVLKKVNGKKKFLYRQRRHLSYPLKRMLCYTLIQPHYDFLHVAPGIQICQCH